MDFGILLEVGKCFGKVGSIMGGRGGVVGCLAVIGGFVLVLYLLSTFWTLAVGFGPLGFAVMMALVFFAGFVLGGQR